MRLVLEQSDFPPESGKRVEELNDPTYGFTVRIEQRPGEKAFATIQHRGTGYRVETPQLKVELDGEERAGFEPAEKPKPKKQEKVKVVQASWEAPLTGPRLQTLAWAEDE